MLQQATALAARAGNQPAAEQELAYLTSNRSRMRYAECRAAGVFIGSGVIEAGCKTVIGQRTKRSGMHWGEAGVQAVVTRRCALRSNRLDAFWAYTFARPPAA